MLMITLYAKQKKRHRYIEQTFGLCGRRQGWDDLREEHWNIYYQVWNRPPAQAGCMSQVLRAGALGRPRGMGLGGRWERGSGWRTHVNPWLIHVSIWRKPLQYCKVISFQLIKVNETNKNKIKNKMGNSSTSLKGLMWGLNEMKHHNFLTEHLMHGKY